MGHEAFPGNWGAGEGGHGGGGHTYRHFGVMMVGLNDGDAQRGDPLHSQARSSNEPGTLSQPALQGWEQAQYGAQSGKSHWEKEEDIPGWLECLRTFPEDC